MSFVSSIEKELLGFAVEGVKLIENGFTQGISLLAHFFSAVITASFPALGILGPTATVGTIGLSIGAATLGFFLIGGARDLTEVTP